MSVYRVDKTLTMSAVRAGISLACVLLSTLQAMTALAAEDATSPQAHTDAAQQRLQRTFHNLSVTGFGESPIKGVYEVQMGESVIYFAAEEEVLIFGEMYSKDGVSLTLKGRDLSDKKLLGELPANLGVRVEFSESSTPADRPARRVVEFMSFECPFCVKANAIFTAQHVTRETYLLGNPGTQAQKKAVHVLCQPKQDRASAIQALMTASKPIALDNCAAGEALAQQHLDAAKKLGVGATPTVFIGARRVEGFKPDTLDALLK